MPVLCPPTSVFPPNLIYTLPTLLYWLQWISTAEISDVPVSYLVSVFGRLHPNNPSVLNLPIRKNRKRKDLSVISEPREDASGSNAPRSRRPMWNSLEAMDRVQQGIVEPLYPDLPTVRSYEAASSVLKCYKQGTKCVCFCLILHLTCSTLWDSSVIMMDYNLIIWKKCADRALLKFCSRFWYEFGNENEMQKYPALNGGQHWHALDRTRKNHVNSDQQWILGASKRFQLHSNVYYTTRAAHRIPLSGR